MADKKNSKKRVQRKKLARPRNVSDDELTVVAGGGKRSAGGGTTGASEHGDIIITKFVDMASP